MPSDSDVPQRHYNRFDPDQSDEDLERAVTVWLEEILGPLPDEVHLPATHDAGATRRTD